jgi:hypothetical protein
MKRLCWGHPRRIAEPGRGADPNSVPDLAGAGTSAAGAVAAVVLLSPAAAVTAARRRRTRHT